MTWTRRCRGVTGGDTSGTLIVIGGDGGPLPLRRLVPKWRPDSPGGRDERRESQAACAAASPSEMAGQAGSTASDGPQWYQRGDPSTAPNGCTSVPMPIAGSDQQ